MTVRLQARRGVNRRVRRGKPGATTGNSDWRCGDPRRVLSELRRISPGRRSPELTCAHYRPLARTCAAERIRLAACSLSLHPNKRRSRLRALAMPNLSPPPNVGIPTTGRPPASVPAKRIVEQLLDVSRRSSLAKAGRALPRLRHRTYHGVRERMNSRRDGAVSILRHTGGTWRLSR
jgi:hypothetical protein